MASLDLTSFASALKILYPAGKIAEMGYRSRPFYAMVSKDEGFFGKSMQIPIRITTPQGRAAVFATAQANKVASVYKDFTITRSKDYAFASIDNETLLASEANEGAFLKAVTSEMDGAIESLHRSLAWSLYGNGTGVIGAVGSITYSTNTVVLAEPEDIVKFEVGQQLVSYDTTNATQRIWDTAVYVVTVATIDRDTGTFTTNAVMTSSKTVVATDLLFTYGDRGTVAAPGKLSGLAAWVPPTAPTLGVTFFGCDRAVDSVRLSGRRVNGTALTIEEALTDAARKIGREGGKPDVCFMSYSKWADLEKSLGTKVKYESFTVGEIGFTALQVQGPRGPIKVIADTDCPNGYAWMLQMDTWELHSLGPAVRLSDVDGNKMLRETSSDGVEIRVASYAQLSCDAPGYNAVISL